VSCHIQYNKKGLRFLKAPFSSSYLKLRHREFDLSSDIRVNRCDHAAPLVRVEGGNADGLQRRSYILSGKTLLLAVGQ